MNSDFSSLPPSGAGFVEDEFRNSSLDDSSHMADPLFTSQAKTQKSASRAHGYPPASRSRRSSSSDLSSEIAPEIVVWTEDMDVDSESEDEPDGSSDMDIK